MKEKQKQLAIILVSKEHVLLMEPLCEEGIYAQRKVPLPSVFQSIRPNLVWVSTQELYMLTDSYFHGRSNLHGACAL